jgi:predicted DNA-binding transcriptional regulator YafY
MPFTDDEELLTERELAKYTKRSKRQLQRDRANRRGFPYVQLENQIRYRRGDVRAHLAQHLVGSNTEQRAKHTAAATPAALQPKPYGRPRSSDGGGR